MFLLNYTIGKGEKQGKRKEWRGFEGKTGKIDLTCKNTC